MAKAWLVDEEVYDLLLGIPWMRRIGLNQSYDGGKVTVCGQNSLATGGFYQAVVYTN